MLLAAIIVSGGLSSVSQVCQEEVEVDKSGWKMSADGLEDFQAVLEQLSVHLKISAPDL
jgi:hypothetical protein